ncbi:MAG: 50S ribosomal protein L18 [Parcubacteria group bacterium]|nr:50S ribosomal protein L18 [Parcubacteria group bacterium]
MASKTEERKRRHARLRFRVRGTAARPRLAVFRSNKHFFAQLIDDDSSRTLLSVRDAQKEKSKTEALRSRAERAGAALAERARSQGISRVVFDRGGFRYAGIVKAFADAARNGGLEF